MAWEPDNSGIKQDHRGRFFRTLYNSRGKQDIQYVQPTTDAPRAETIPIPPEPTPKQHYNDNDSFVTTGINGERRNVVHLPRRKHVVEFRPKGESTVQKIETDNAAEYELYVYANRAKVAWKFDPQEGILVQDLDRHGNCANYEQLSTWDYFTQYHKDEESV